MTDSPERQTKRAAYLAKFVLDPTLPTDELVHRHGLAIAAAERLQRKAEGLRLQLHATCALRQDVLACRGALNRTIRARQFPESAAKGHFDGREEGKERQEKAGAQANAR